MLFQSLLDILRGHAEDDQANGDYDEIAPWQDLVDGCATCVGAESMHSELQCLAAEVLELACLLHIMKLMIV